jgi:glutaredoxin
VTLTPARLFAFAAALFLVVVYWSGGGTTAAADPRSTTGDDGVVLLSASWCGYCDRLRGELGDAGVPFREIDVETTAEGRDAFDALNGRGVPVTVIGQEVVHGYDVSRLEELLQARGHTLVQTR